MTESVNKIRFLLDDKVHIVEGIEPTTTLLQYLRERLSLTGTKEGCAEGDCGACTVVQADLHEGRIRYRAVNSCIQFLPTLHGKALITVENLKTTCAGKLHPVQQAMVDSYGSQCGFCTPGFVMSLFALYKSNPDPQYEDIKQTLAGNLCRCTGYRPIIAAAVKMYEYGNSCPVEERNWMTEPCPEEGREVVSANEEEFVTRLQSVKPDSAVELDGIRCRYFAPADIDALQNYLQQKPDATILAGGTDIGLWVTKEHRDIPDIVYIGNIPELESSRTTDKCLEIGAAVTLSGAFDLLAEHYPDLYEIIRRFASPPICNLGTLCGNIANGSPVGDTMPALMVLSASLVLSSTAGEREVPLDEFYTGYKCNVLRPGEFVRAVRVPLPVANSFLRSYKIAKRFDQDISAICGAYWIRFEGDLISDVRIAYGGMAETPRRAVATEEYLQHNSWSQSVISSAKEALESEYTPMTDLRAGSEYRQSVAANLLQRFYNDVNGESNISVWSYAG